MGCGASSCCRHWKGPAENPQSPIRKHHQAWRHDRLFSALWTPVPHYLPDHPGDESMQGKLSHRHEVCTSRCPGVFRDLGQGTGPYSNYRDLPGRCTNRPIWKGQSSQPAHPRNSGSASGRVWCGNPIKPHHRGIHGFRQAEWFGNWAVCGWISARQFVD